MAAHAQTFAFQGTWVGSPRLGFGANLLPAPTVDVHALWGLFLGLFAAFRFLTYFFLYLRPPASILPSGPPTEALAALTLTCGGVVFILSTEQVTFAAMRHGFDDLMVRRNASLHQRARAELMSSPLLLGVDVPQAFLNFTVTLVSITFAWIVCLFALQGESGVEIAGTCS